MQKRLRLYIAPNWVASLWKMPLRAVLFPIAVHDMALSTGGTVTSPLLMLFGIHSTN